MSANTRFDDHVREAEAQWISGWDFSFVAGRLIEETLAWDYRKLVAHHMSYATCMVDLCTGGGEFLDGFRALPANTYATEGFPPNVQIAKDRLTQRGVRVFSFSSEGDLPLPSDTFDLVINRHGIYSAKELQRITRADALFLTQQVGTSNALGINQALNAPASKSNTWRLNVAIDALITAGFSITQSQEAFPEMSFKDIGALVFYLRAVPWQVPDFDVRNFRASLLQIHRQIEERGSFDVYAHRFLIEAKRNG